MKNAEKQKIDLWGSVPQVISNKENLQLIAKFKDTGDKAILDQIVYGNLGRAKKFFSEKTIRRFTSSKASKIFDKEDLYQEAGLAIVDAVLKFDFNKGNNFEFYLNNAFINLLGRESQYLKTQKRSAIDTCDVNDDADQNLLLNNASNAQSAPTKSAKGKRPNVAQSDEHSQVEYIKLHKKQDENWQQLEQLLEDKLDLLYIKQSLLPILSEEERQIFEDYYFKNISKAEIGKKLGISRQAVDVRIEKSLQKILVLHQTGTTQKPVFETKDGPVYLHDMERYLDIFNEDLQKFLKLRLIEGKSLNEIACETHRNPNHISNAISAAKRELEKIYYLSKRSKIDPKFIWVLNSCKPIYRDIFLEYIKGDDTLTYKDIAKKHSVTSSLVGQAIKSVYGKMSKFDDIKIPSRKTFAEIDRIK